MKVAIISDTHNKITKVYDYLFDKEIDIIVHLGDVCDDAILLEELLKVEVIYVKGNTIFMLLVVNMTRLLGFLIKIFS